MFSSLAIAVLALASAAQAALPQPEITTITRNGRQGELRIINRAVVAPTAWFFSQNGNSSLLFSNAAVKATGTIGSAPAAAIGASVAAGTASDFVKVDTGAGGSLNVVIVSPLNESLPICQFTVADGARTTVVVRTTLTAGTPTTRTGTCNITGGNPEISSCSQVSVANDAKVTFTCTTLSDTLSTARSCSDHRVRFYNFLTESCTNKRLKRTDVTVPAGTSLFLDAALPTGDTSANNAVLFNRQQAFSVDTTPLALDSEGRFTDVILTGASSVDTKTFKTGFLNMVNVAFRLTGTAPSQNLNNTFTVVIVEGNTLSAVNTVHIDESLTANEAAGWIEVRSGVKYTAFVFPASTTELQIFGDNSLAMPTAATASPLKSFELTNELLTNEMRIFRITSSTASVAGSGNAEPDASSVPLNGTVAAGTKFVTWNQLFDRSIRLLTTNDTACRADTASINHNGVFVFTTTTTVGPFPVHSGDAKCSALSPLTGATISFSNSGAAACKVQGSFVVGRTVTRNVTQTCIEPSTTCNAGVTGLSKITSSGDSEGFDLVVIPAVPMCSCAAVPAAPVCEDVCEADKFADVLSSVAATRAAVISAGATTNSLQGTIVSRLNTFQNSLFSIEKRIKKTDKTIRDIEDGVDDLIKESKN
jgi:hypothetical protein